jgi:hypothetical protein
MKEIEILSDENRAPQVYLHGEALKLATEKGVGKIHISLSHSEVSFLVFPQQTLTLMFIYRLLPLHLPKLLPDNQLNLLTCSHRQLSFFFHTANSVDSARIIK